MEKWLSTQRPHGQIDEAAIAETEPRDTYRIVGEPWGFVAGKRRFSTISRRNFDTRRAAQIERRRLLAVALFAITTSAKRPSTADAASFAFNVRVAGVFEPGREPKGAFFRR